MTPTPHDHALQQARADHAAYKAMWDEAVAEVHETFHRFHNQDPYTAAILTLATILNLQEGE